jgi:release factor glutamine methyltransferase
MLPTPSTDHVSFNHTYEPAEDSFLLMDALSTDTESAFLRERFSPCSGLSGTHEQESNHDTSTEIGSNYACPIVCEVGVGSGVVLAFVSAHAHVLFGRPDILTLGTDVNGMACRESQDTVLRALKEAECVSCAPSLRGPNLSVCAPVSRFQAILQGDLAGPLRAGLIDVLIFNPPYVPTPEVPVLRPGRLQQDTTAMDDGEAVFQRDSYLLSLAYAGGKNGMETTDRLMEELPDILSYPLGVAYILLCAQNGPEAVKQRIKNWSGGWDAKTVARTGRHAGWEKLQIIRIWRVR